MQTKAAAPNTIAEFVQRYGKQPVTYAALFQATDVLMKALKHHQDRADALAKGHEDMSTRVLELQAVLASRLDPVPLL